MKHHNDRNQAGRTNAKRFLIAAETLLKAELSTEFANDVQSVAFVLGEAPDVSSLTLMSHCVAKTGASVVLFQFEPGREHLGPQSTAVIVQRDGLVYSFTDCVLWAPEGDGPFLILPTKVNSCFAYDGLALIHRPGLPTSAISGGVARARARLRSAARAVTDAQVMAFDGHPQAQAA